MEIIKEKQCLAQIEHLTAIGGGHGLGRVMSALSFLQERLSGIVTTTDNGGSTGRIRNDLGGIAWGDLRNCINQIITKPTTASAVFEYRFEGTGELHGHNLGNLILKALENMEIRPTEVVNLIRNFLRIKSFIIPMSDTPVDLTAITQNNQQITGEVNVDALAESPKSLGLFPQVQATPEAITAIEQADVILFGPGSFLTSIMPVLLLPDLQNAIAQSSAIKIFIDNLGTEHGAAAKLSLAQRIEWINRTIGKNTINGVITSIENAQNVKLPNHILLSAQNLSADDVSYRHDRLLLANAIDEIVNTLKK